MWNATNRYAVKQPTSQYFAAQLLTQQWAEPVDQTHDLFAATTDVVDGKGREIVTAYAVRRPDGQWAVLLVNKDPSRSYAVQVAFDLPSGTAAFTSPVAGMTLSPAQYVWKPNKRNGTANPDGPPAMATLGGGASATYTLPASSLVVLRGTIAPSTRNRRR
jgi:hypothetical protein